MRVNALIAAIPIAAVVIGLGNGVAAADTISTDAVSPASHTVTVQEGDYLAKIAGDNGTTYVRLYDANMHITNPDLIHPGETIRIPSPDEQLPDRPLPSHTAGSPALAAPVVEEAPRPSYQPVAAPISVTGSGSVWDNLAQCESSGNWSIDTGNGFYGGLQFDYGTWLDNGGGAYAAQANLATREQQIEIAAKVQAARGWAPWPACSAKLGL